ncbi:hypothetical protein PZA11_001591 [Diplocarpon coronariae]
MYRSNVNELQAPGSTAIQCYAPATGEFLGLVNPTTPEGIDRAVEKAQSAQQRWKNTTFTQRRQVLRCMLRFILDNQEDICRVACLDSGKTMIDATLGEILVTVEKLRWTLRHGEKALKRSHRPTNLLMMYKKNTVVYEPLGVVSALVSWNYPFHNLIGPVISAIFAGNGIVVKASEYTAWSSSYFSHIVKDALHVCGHNTNLVQVVTTWPHTANHLTSHPSVSHVTFIGSRPNCIGIERIIACPLVYDQLVNKLEPRIKALRVGSTLDAPKDAQVDVGAMISDASFDRLERLVSSAVKDGARLLAGGQRFNHPVHQSGHYFQPTFLVDVTPDMAIAKEECFGPICVLMKAENAEEACRIANAPDFGLGASIFGAPGYIVDGVIRNLKTGMVSVNDFAVYYAVQLPFGGQRGSGYGRFAGEEGLRGLCNIKAVCEDRLFWAGIKTAIPSQIHYPIPDTMKGYEFTRAVVEVGYGVGLWEKIKGLKRMIKNS